jgi:hypothetical protein
MVKKKGNLMHNSNKWLLILATFSVQAMFATHEALNPNPTQSGLIEKEPPLPLLDPIAPQPSPDTRWVPGYFSWNPEKQDFEWEPGIWIKAPEGTVWVPGKWKNDQGGYIRIQGYFAKKLQETEAPLPNLKETLDTQAPSQSPVAEPKEEVMEEKALIIQYEEPKEPLQTIQESPLPNEEDAGLEWSAPKPLRVPPTVPPGYMRGKS